MSALEWSVLSFFLGLLLGHWLAIGRDRRKEFNESAGPVREWILLQLDHPEWGLSEPPTLVERDAFVQRLGVIRRASFNRLWAEMIEEYARNVRQDPETGFPIYTRSEALWQIFKQIEPITRAR
ncbi:hypothetical protein ABE424_03625 [Stenotrophomonas sp. TWI1149]|uniref:hypothetical protein n=1 Tax=unclassified Stenotrophomonas TaxID=196198 RepID=UPI0032079027